MKATENFILNGSSAIRIGEGGFVVRERAWNFDGSMSLSFAASQFWGDHDFSL
jgi:hypothetical protein